MTVTVISKMQNKYFFLKNCTGCLMQVWQSRKIGNSVIIACTVGCGNEGNGKSWMGDQGSTVSTIIVLYLKMHHFVLFCLYNGYQ